MYNSQFRHNDAIRQLIDFDRDHVRMRSSVAAHFILREIIDPNVIVDVLVNMAQTAEKLAPISPHLWGLANRTHAISKPEFIASRKRAQGDDYSVL